MVDASSTQLVPKLTSSCGSPYLLHHYEHAYRFGEGLIPYFGIGKFVVSVNGPVTMLSWSFESIKNAQGAIDYPITTISHLTVADASKFMSENAQHIHLEDFRNWENP